VSTRAGQLCHYIQIHRKVENEFIVLHIRALDPLEGSGYYIYMYMYTHTHTHTHIYIYI